jgi:hypothetical protein
MARCFDDRDLSQLDPVTFFIVTELMIAEGEERPSKPPLAVESEFEHLVAEVA